MSIEFYEELKAMVGEEGSRIVAVDDVCKPMIRHWCEAMQDGNPLYTDEEYARKSKYGGIIAPPTMLLTWTMPPLWPPRQQPPHPFEKFLARMDKAGFYGILITNVAQKYLRPVFPGDHINFTYKVTDVSPEKQTGLGKGHFVTTTFIFNNQKGETVGTQSLTVLKYRIGP
jgi:acyl dehydratase